MDIPILVSHPKGTLKNSYKIKVSLFYFQEVHLNPIKLKNMLNHYKNSQKSHNDLLALKKHIPSITKSQYSHSDKVCLF